MIHIFSQYASVVDLISRLKNFLPFVILAKSKRDKQSILSVIRVLADRTSYCRIISETFGNIHV